MPKPHPSEFEVFEARVWHPPTGERFHPHPGKPADDRWQDGYGEAAADYDQEEVRRMGRFLWAEHIKQLKRKR